MDTLRKYRLDVYLLILIIAILGIFWYLAFNVDTFFGPIAEVPPYYWLLLGGLVLAWFLLATRKIRRDNNTIAGAIVSLAVGVLQFLLFRQLFTNTGWTGATVAWAIGSIGLILMGALRLAFALRR